MHVFVFIYTYIKGGTVQYVPRFGDHASIRFRYNRKKNWVLFIYFKQTVVQITIFFHLDVKILIINTIITFLYYA